MLEWHIKEGTDGIVAVGTTGESPTLSNHEHKEFISYVVKQVAGRLPVTAGAGSNSTAEAIAMAQHAQAAGADAVLMVVPYYNKPTQHGLVRHFAEISEHTDIPQILYNVPSRTITDLMPETVAEISEYKNVIGIKEATGDLDRVKRIRELCHADFILLSGDDITCCDFILAGGHGCISVTANIVPAQLSELCRLAQEGNEVEAKGLQEKLMPLHNALFLEANPIPIKYALAITQRIKGHIRLPLTELSHSHRPQLEAILESFNL